MKPLPEVLANHKIYRNPRSEVVPTGRIGDEGHILYAPKSQIIDPGTKFHVENEDELRRLLEAGAITVLDSGWEPEIEAAEKVFLAERGCGVVTADPKPEKPQPRYPFQTTSDSSFEDLF